MHDRAAMSTAKTNSLQSRDHPTGFFLVLEENTISFRASSGLMVDFYSARKLKMVCKQVGSCL